MLKFSEWFRGYPSHAFSISKMYTCVEKGILENVSKCQKASWTIGQIGQINNTQDHFKINQF